MEYWNQGSGSHHWGTDHQKGNEHPRINEAKKEEDSLPEAPQTRIAMSPERRISPLPPP